jgi:hypothetical protein
MLWKICWGTWATYWEPIENLKRTHWEQEKNEKKNPSSSQQRLGWAPNSNLILFPWPQGISLLQNGPFCEAEGPMPDFAGLHRGVFNRSGKCKEGGGIDGVDRHPSLSSLCPFVWTIITYSKGRKFLPLIPDGQWLRTVVAKYSTALNRPHELQTSWAWESRRK